MKISVITVCYNSEKTIETAIESIINQDYKNIELIVIDGKSTDSTLDILKKYDNHIHTLISEKDKGIYDAMNKGLQKATGDIIGTLNSDDLYVKNNILSKIVSKFNHTNCDIVYGDLYYVKQNNTNKIIRHWVTKPFKPDSFKKGWHPPHPTFFVKNHVYKNFGYFNLKYKLAADFELMLRLLEKHRINSAYINIPLVKMRLGGATNKNLKNIFNQNIECYKAFKNNNLKVSILYPFYRLIPKLFQF